MDFQDDGMVDEGMRISSEKKGTAMLAYQATLSAWMIAALVTINLSGLFAIVSNDGAGNVRALILSAFFWVSGILFAVCASVSAALNAGFLAAFFLDVAALPPGTSFERVRSLPTFARYEKARKHSHLPIILGSGSAAAFVIGTLIMGLSSLVAHGSG